MLWILIIPSLSYCFILFFIIRNLRPMLQPIRKESEENLFISIVVACRNEEKNIQYLMSDIVSQTYPAEYYELIIANDNSTDRTVKLAEAYKQVKNLRIINNSRKGKKSALFEGISAAKGSFILTTDADCRFGRNWIREFALHFEETGADFIAGPVMIDEGQGFLQKFQVIEFIGLQGVSESTFNSGSPVLCNGANLAFRKELYFRHYQNLRPEIVSGDDIFLLHSIKKDAASKMVFFNSVQALVSTKAARSFLPFLKQRARWLSKSREITDSFSRFLAIVTFVTNLNLLFLPLGLFIFSGFIPVALTVVFLKFLPDLILLAEYTGRYGRPGILRWFIPSALIYPLYVLIVFVYSRFRKNSW